MIALSKERCSCVLLYSGGDSVLFTEMAIDILRRRYLLKDEEPEDMFRRVAEDIAGVENKDDCDYWAKRFFEIMMHLEFLPNSPCLFNAGTGNGLSYSACYGLPVEDSIEGIFETLKKAAIIIKSGGGVGFNFSTLRPEGDIVRSTMGVSSGPVSFMKVYNEMIEQVRQGGKRRGAAIAVMRADHPDILKFIRAKHEEGALSNFNISVFVTDEFMQAVLNNDDWRLINPRDGSTWAVVKAREIFDEIVYGAWKNGEPGVLFYDAINRTNPCKHIGSIDVVNPCSEVNLMYYESCNLGSINLSEFVDGKDFDWSRLERVVQIAVRFLDNVIDAQPYELKEVEKATKRTRKIGLGIMGWHDALIKLGIAYNSNEAIEKAEQVMRFIRDVAYRTSMILAEEKGTFLAWKGSEWEKKGMRMRNATLTAIAPTGSLSIIANCSSSIEPVFNWVYLRRNVMDREYFVVHGLFEEMLKSKGLHDEKILWRVYNEGTIQTIDEFDNETKRVFVNALDISWDWHIRMQAAFQKYVDNSISKTINMRADAGLEDVRNAIIMAWKSGCKGITIYRTGSRNNEVMTYGGCKGGKCSL